MTLPHFSPESWQYVFNTPLECGLRCGAVLLAAHPARCDLQRLVQYEYLLVHSGDVGQGPPSLHPPVPHRAGELLVRRGLIERGLLFMMSRQLVCREPSDRGINYFAGELALPFFDALEAGYTRHIRERALWVVERFGGVPDDSLHQFMRANWTSWGSEFIWEVFVREGGE